VPILTVDTANGCGSVATMADHELVLVLLGPDYVTWGVEPGEIVRYEAPPCELEYPECGYELDVSSAGVFTMRTAERVCLGVYLEGRLVEVQGPVQS
jgi:hypothetical protein